jgi:UTP--glucose-1-phosphate uridylyltransferase
MQQPVRKAIFPVAGLGTRFLPATKAMPKEMLTVVDRPLIQIAVDEAKEAGIEHFIFVTGRNKGVIEDHFDKQYELESNLQKRGKTFELHVLEQDLIPPGQASFTRQQEPLGLGHAIWCARNMVGSEPFAVLLPDMVMHARPGCLAQMIETYNQRGGGNVVAVEEMDEFKLHRYGVVGVGDRHGRGFSITSMVEKPSPGTAPSNYIISGRYILQPEIFGLIGSAQPGVAGEIQITDAMIKLLKHQPFHGLLYEGKTYDCGDKLGFLAANLAFGLEDENLGSAFRLVLKEVVETHGGHVSWETSPGLAEIVRKLRESVPPSSQGRPDELQTLLQLPAAG